MSRPTTLGGLANPAGCRCRSRRSSARTPSRASRRASPRRGRPRLRGHRAPAARERAARRPRRDLPRRAGPGEDPHDPLAHRPARRVDADRRRQRDQRRPVRPVSHHARDLVAEQGDDTPIEWVHRDVASVRSSPPPTRRSPTSSVRSTRSRSPRVATCRMNSPSTARPTEPRSRQRGARHCSAFITGTVDGG